MISVDVSPSRHNAHIARCGAGFGQGHRLDILVHGDGVRQPHQHNVVVQGLVVITLMPVDGIHWHVLLRALVHPDVVVTQDGNLCKGAEKGRKNKIMMILQTIQFTEKCLNTVIQYKLLPAVGSRDDPPVVNEGAAAEVVADVEGHLPGLRVGSTLVATHNPVICRGCRCGIKVKQNAAYHPYNFFFYPKTFVNIADVLYLQRPEV